MLQMKQNNIPISTQVKMYIERKPYVLEAIEQNIVNYSALAREVGKDLGLKSLIFRKFSLTFITNSCVSLP